ncbi:glycogen debranching N-terminal domain-containing protein [Terrabacter aeriphilus]|uniref:Glycogen debranching N-terminal domain-containing protein n=1 Tax=Terrabacter aeriphilus TaxID=515662 RepID=A0ABP9JP89_9MICO
MSRHQAEDVEDVRDATHAPDSGLPASPADAAGRQPWLHDLVICVDGNGTALSDADGAMRGSGAHGFFVDDQRVVSEFVIGLVGADLVHVAHAARGSRGEFLTSARGVGDPGADPTVEVHRSRHLAGGVLREQVVVTSRASTPVETELVVRLGGDGADISVVKSGLATGHLLEPRRETDATTGWQSAELTTRVELSPAPAALTTGADGVRASFPLRIEPGSRAVVEVVVGTERRGASMFAADTGSDAVDWPERLEVEAGDPRLGRLLETSLTDLRSLLLRDPADLRDVFTAAGTPWYLTLFGRDSLWAARMALPLGTDLAGGTLRALARRQGTRHDASTAEAPGKIPHELRRTSHAHDADSFHLPPVYWGTVDATALWICLLHDAWRWGLADDEVRDLLPALRSAASWLTELATPDDDGLIKYVDESGHGLVNQGWKDSGDSMRFRDGSLAASPIALVEAQAYAVEAAVAAATLLRAFGTTDGPDGTRADELERWAEALRDRVRSRFWVGGPDDRYLAMAIDGDDRPVDGVGSNMGHALGTGALTPEEARRVTDTLTAPTMLGSFGIATLANDNGGFNPIGYHTGSVWVHDTAICALGMAREGHATEAAAVARRLLDVGEAFDYRLPELFADDAVFGRPAPYPASCRPQAWAAASSVAMLTVALGISADVPNRTVRLRPPARPPFGALRVRGLRVGEAVVTVEVGADGTVTVDGLPSDFTLER